MLFKHLKQMIGEQDSNKKRKRKKSLISGLGDRFKYLMNKYLLLLKTDKTKHHDALTCALRCKHNDLRCDSIDLIKVMSKCAEMLALQTHYA